MTASTKSSPQALRPVGIPWSVQAADSAMKRYDPANAQWHYEHGLLFKAWQQVGAASGEARYGQFVQQIMDQFVRADGSIRTYRREDYNLDQINPGKSLFQLYRASGQDRYRQALFLLRDQLRRQPRNQAGGFWHKQIYPDQMWLDGLYMAAPFYAEFAATFDEPAAFADIEHQFQLIERQARDGQTGLLYHAWDESRAQAWANPQTGCSPHAWGRAMGWFGMALIDTLDFVPKDHTAFQTLRGILERLGLAIHQTQEPTSGLWYQVMDQSSRAGNYLETSASAMFVYALAKGVRLGYLPGRLAQTARQGYAGLLQHKLEVDEHGLVNLKDICSVAGLGGQQYRDGSYAYYVGEPVVANDYKGVGAFILAALEMEAAGWRPTE
jgi:unsaturated rhamnogalacturonyl hydrolase